MRLPAEAGHEFKEKKLLAVLHSNVDDPEKPSFDNPYQLVETKAGPMTSYLPSDLSSEIFDFGVSSRIPPQTGICKTSDPTNHERVG